MKKFLIPTIILCMLFSLTACSDSNESSISSESYEASENSDSDNGTTNSSLKTTSSDLDSPLSVDTWGIAAKYSTKEQEYYNIPVRIISITRGDDASEIVKTFTQENSAYDYIEPESYSEWVVAEYELSLDGFPIDEGGVDCSITSFVTSKNGGYLEYSGTNWSTTTINITDGEYYYEGAIKGQIAFLMLKDCSDYVITLGEYDETQAFFSESNNNSD